MTAWPIPENHDHWWLHTWSGNRLHAIPDAPTRQEALEEGAALTKARCGLIGTFMVPALGDRLGLPRCAQCCSVLGIPRGIGTPANERRAS